MSVLRSGSKTTPALRINLLPTFNRVMVQVEDDRGPPGEGEDPHSPADLEGLVISLFNWRSERHHRALTDRQGRIDWPALPSGDYLMNVGMQSLKIGLEQHPERSSHIEKLTVSAEAAIARNKSANQDAVVSMKGRGGGGAGWSDPKIWAVSTIQALLRRFIRDRKELREYSALRLQTAYRCYTRRWRYEAGRRVRVATRSILLTQKFARRMILRQQWRDLKRGVLLLQSFIRRFLVIVREDNRFRKAMRIQAWVRRRRYALGRIANQVMNEKTKAATTLQSVWRGTGVQQYYQSTILSSVNVIQAAVRARQYRKFQGELKSRLGKKRAELALSPPFAALLIQSSWRRHTARVQTPPYYIIDSKKLRSAATRSKSRSFGGTTLPRRKSIVSEAATRIQCRWRGFRLRWLIWLIRSDAFQFSSLQHGWFKKVRSPYHAAAAAVLPPRNRIPSQSRSPLPRATTTCLESNNESSNK